jgi:hypothetical protein
MKGSILSEKNLVVVLFIMVVVIFSFAQADTKEIQKRVMDITPSATTTLDQSQSTTADSKNTQVKQSIPSAQLR